MKRQVWLLLVLIGLVALAGCGTWESWYVEDGVLVDQVFSVETRRNGTTLV